MKCINRSTISLVSACAALVVCARALAGATECVIVAGDRIVLGDLAPVLPATAVDDAERIVGFSPRPGVRRTLQFREWAGGARGPLAGEPEEICVERVARTLTRDELTAALEAAFAGAGSGITIDVQEFPRGAVPVGTLVFPDASLRAARPDSQSGLVQLAGYVEFGSAPGRPLRFPVWVRARIESDTVQTKLTCPLAAGDEITSACVEEKPARAYPFAQTGSPLGLSALAGRTARRRLTPGTILREAMLYQRQDVKPRQEINLVVRCGQARLRLRGTSEGGGAAGDWITVRLADSNRRLRVRVTAAGAAELLVPAEDPPKGT